MASLTTMASGIESQVEDLSKQISNMDSLTNAAVARVKNSTENQFFIKETGLDGKGIILNQGESINGIRYSLLRYTAVCLGIFSGPNGRGVAYTRVTFIPKKSNLGK